MPIFAIRFMLCRISSLSYNWFFSNISWIVVSSKLICNSSLHMNTKMFRNIILFSHNWTTNVRLIFSCISRWCCLFVIHFVVWFEMALHSVNKEVDLKSVCFCRTSNFYKFLECMYQYRDYLCILNINNLTAFYSCTDIKSLNLINIDTALIFYML